MNIPKTYHTQKRSSVSTHHTVKISQPTRANISWSSSTSTSPKYSNFTKIFNRNTVKVSYCCMPIVASITKSRNKKVSSKKANKETRVSHAIVGRITLVLCKVSVWFPATSTTQKWKRPNYLSSIDTMSISSHSGTQNISTAHNYPVTFWKLKQKKKEPLITWSIAGKAHSYDNETKRCNLCLTEVLFIFNSDRGRLLSRRSELISKCRHQNKFNLANFTKDIT